MKNLAEVCSDALGAGLTPSAIHLQRVHVTAAEARRKDKNLTLEAAVAAVDISENRSWRPFQLAFLLLNLPS